MKWFCRIVRLTKKVLRIIANCERFGKLDIFEKFFVFDLRLNLLSVLFKLAFD